MAGIQKVSGPELASSLEALSHLAERIDPFDFAPGDGVAARIFTLGPFHLREPEYEAVIDASGSAFALLANLTPDGQVHGGPVWRIQRSYPFEHLKSDPCWDGISQSAVWDTAGTWLVVVSNEGHGVVAGQQAFVDAVAQTLPHRSDDIVEIVDRLLVGRPDTADYDARVMAMVARLYGTVEAQRIRDQLGGAA